MTRNPNPPRRSYDAFAGMHRQRNTRNTIEVYYKTKEAKAKDELAGWYWRPVPYDDLTQTEQGPFASSRAAFRHAMNVEN